MGRGVGVNDGLNVGDCVGLLDGDGVGLGVRTNVGLLVGTAVGLLVGTGVGFLVVGFLVGENVEGASLEKACRTQTDVYIFIIHAEE